MTIDGTNRYIIYLKPRTDGQVFLDKFSLTSFICSCVRQKIDKFSLTRSLVQKLVMPAFQQGNLLVCAAVKEMRSRELRINIFVCVRLVKLVKEKMVNFLSYTRANKTRQGTTCQGKLVRRTHEQVNSSRKLVKENLPVCTGL